MTLVYPNSRLPIRRFGVPSTSSHSLRISATLPFPPDNARFHRELGAAVDVVERACRLCVDVKKSLLSNDARILQKNDQTPVTIADFGVQALISLELKRLFPLIPLVAEEDSTYLRSSSVSSQANEGKAGNFLVDSVVSAVADKGGGGDETLTSDDVLEAIDRGGKDAVSFSAKPATYWVLDPIDGTRVFLKGSDALYVVGLALVVEGRVALGVMGCPNWNDEFFPGSPDDKSDMSGLGIIMVSHIGCGTWKRKLSRYDGNVMRIQDVWGRCFVDSCHLVPDARVCIPESQTWESIPLSGIFGSTVDADSTKNAHNILLLPTCCGSLCKYMMVASGRASVFILRARIGTVIKVWDHAVGVVCVHEAGGQVSDWRGSPLDLAADQEERRIIFPSGGVLVSNGSLHKQLLGMISSNLSTV